MASFLLVHGSWHGAWCWERLLPLLFERGHRAVTLDLPAHGEDRTPFYRATLGGYARQVREAAAALPDPPLLVGHSMGGLAITQAAGDAPELFAGLVYLCAFVPLPGDTLMKLVRQDTGSLVSASIRFGLRGTIIEPGLAAPAFYAGCSEPDARWATDRLKPDPVWPALQRMKPRHEHGLPRAYVECTEDRAISLGHQRRMAARAGIQRTVTLPTDHSPFLSAPSELAAALDGLADLAGARPTLVTG